MRPFFSNVGSGSTHKYLKMCSPVGNKTKHLSKLFLKIGEHFVLFFIIFGLILCAEYSPRGNGSSGEYRKTCNRGAYCRFAIAPGHVV